MTSTLAEATVAAERLETAVRPRPTWRRWLVRACAVVVCVWLIDFASPVVIGHTPVRRWLTRRLEAGFGRPVEVGSYSLDLWTGPAIEARQVTVAEDARFGQEYFLRAESMRVRLRLVSLFAGRIEPGTLALSHPSLNLVKNAAGDWNLAEWLPKPGIAGGAAAGGTSGSARSAEAAEAARFWRIEVDGGRINFKRGDEKLPFAFANVDGYVESEGGGRWRIDLGAVPSRAAVVVQAPGMLHLSGDLGGTSSRLRPAALAVSWDAASISDVLRIARGYDYGVRGNFAMTANAHTEGSAWKLETRVDLAQAHRWDLAARLDNPSASIHAKASVDWEKESLVVEEATLDTVKSQASGEGDYMWAPVLYAKRPVSPARFAITKASVDLGEALAWWRAFRPTIADDVALTGRAEFRANAGDWPLRVVNLVGSSEGATLNGPRLRAPVKLGFVQGRYDHGGISLMPATVTFGRATGGALEVDVATKPGLNPAPVLHVAGNVTQVRDLIAAAGALGWSLSRGWDVAGAMRCDMRWQSTGGAGGLWHAAPTGFLELGEAVAGGGASLRAPFINEPLEGIRARGDIRPGVTHIALNSADAFGARWTGTLERAGEEGWQFALAADHLSSADLDQWLNPKWRETFLERVLPFLNTSGPTSAEPENLRASGRLSVEQLTVLPAAPIVIHGLTGDLKIDGRRVELGDARGDVFGGTAEGDFAITLAAVMDYRARANFSGVNVTALAAASQTLGNLFAGSASGEIGLEAHGGNHDELVNSFACEGSAHLKDAELRGLDLAASLRDGARRPGKSAFRAASAEFRCGDGRIWFDGMRLSGAAGDVTGSGWVDFTRNLDLRLHAEPDESVATPRAARASYVGGTTYELTGPLAAPRVTVVAVAASAAAANPRQ